MDVLDILKDESADWLRCPPAKEEAIEALVRKTGLSFPEEYLALLRYSNGGGGPLGVEPRWFELDSVEELVEQNEWMHAKRQRQVYVPNEGYQPQEYEYLPGNYFVFGGSGGGELLVFNTQEEQPWKVYHIDMIGFSSEEDAWLSAPDFRAFIEAMGHPYADE